MISLDTYESNCDDNCLNHVLMPEDPSTSWRDTYDYGIKTGLLRCQGTPGK